MSRVAIHVTMLLTVDSLTVLKSDVNWTSQLRFKHPHRHEGGSDGISNLR